MDIEFVCEHCGGTIKVQEYLAGQSIECYHCHGGVVVPMPGEKAVIEFSCLGCGAQFRVPGNRAGSRTKCPKCDALLVVPGASSHASVPPAPALRPSPPPAAAPSSGEFDNLPPPASPYLRKHAELRPRGGARPTAAGQDNEEGYVVPPSSRVPVGTILFWAGLAAVFLIALVVFMMQGEEEGGANYAQLYAEVTPEGLTKIFHVTNSMNEAWRNVRFVVETDRGEFTQTRAEVASKESLILSPDQFTGPGGPMTLSDVQRRLTITATLSDGQTARYSARIAGPGSAPPPRTPPAPGKPQPPAEAPVEEGGTIAE